MSDWVQTSAMMGGSWGGPDDTTVSHSVGYRSADGVVSKNINVYNSGRCEIAFYVTGRSEKFDSEETARRAAEAAS